jgi:hypothetical protein
MIILIVVIQIVLSQVVIVNGYYSDAACTNEVYAKYDSLNSYMQSCGIGVCTDQGGSMNPSSYTYSCNADHSITNYTWFGTFTCTGTPNVTAQQPVVCSPQDTMYRDTSCGKNLSTSVFAKLIWYKTCTDTAPVAIYWIKPNQCVNTTQFPSGNSVQLFMNSPTDSSLYTYLDKGCNTIQEVKILDANKCRVYPFSNAILYIPVTMTSSANALVIIPYLFWFWMFVVIYWGDD